MLKKIFSAAIAIILIFSLCACRFEESDQEIESEDTKFGTFILIKEDYVSKSVLYQYILYDPDTMVMYSFISGHKNGGLTMLYNSDGTPKLYTSSDEIS